MAMPRITSRATYTTPSAVEKDYTDLELDRFTVKALPNGDKLVRAELRPYNWDTKEFANSRANDNVIINIPSLAAEMDRCSAIQAVVNSLGDLLNKLVIEKQLLEEIDALEEGQDPTGLQNQLNSVRTQLGAT